MTPEELRIAREAAYAQRFGTHLPLLAAVIAKAGPGAVLEVGTGHASAPLISEMCRATGRDHVVYEPDPAWAEVTQGLGCLVYHLGSNPTVNRCAVALVDCWGWDRLGWLQKLRDVTEFIVVHDTDDPAGDLKEMNAYLDTFKYRYDYKVMTPWTSVVSMTRSYP